MAAQTYLTDVRQDLSYLLGEDSLPSPWPTRRDTFIQRALEDIYRLYDFEMNKVAATISLTNGIGTLPTNARPTVDLEDLRVVNAGSMNDYIFTPVNYIDSDKYSQGEYKYWLVPNQDGTVTINTTETTVPTVVARYELTAPTINASIATPFPSSMVIAEGSLVYERRAQDKDADVSQESALFRNHLEDVVGSESRDQPIKRAIGKAETQGAYPGQLTTETKDYLFSQIRTP